MPVDRYYTSAELEKGKTVLLEGKERHHLQHVTRHKGGDRVELVNGRGALAKAELLSCSKQFAELAVLEVERERQPAFRAVIAQAIPRINRLDFILEKGTELGMTELWLFPAKQSERKTLSENQLERMRHVMAAAMKQCGRLYLPQLLVRPHFSEWKLPELPLYYGDLNPQAPPFFRELESLSDGALFFIGPESGFSDDEEKALQKLGAKGVWLHPNVLRTDTASLAALVLMAQK